MRTIEAASIACVVSLLLMPGALAAHTRTGTVSSTTTHTHGFTPASSGQRQATRSWVGAGADRFMVMVCGTGADEDDHLGDVARRTLGAVKLEALT